VTPVTITTGFSCIGSGTGVNACAGVSGKVTAGSMATSSKSIKEPRPEDLRGGLDGGDSWPGLSDVEMAALAGEGDGGTELAGFLKVN
jgi:hypothetical protein